MLVNKLFKIFFGVKISNFCRKFRFFKIDIFDVKLTFTSDYENRDFNALEIFEKKKRNIFKENSEKCDSSMSHLSHDAYHRVTMVSHNGIKVKYTNCVTLMNHHL